MQTSNLYSVRPSEATFTNIPNAQLPHEFFVVISIADRQFKSTVNKNSGLNPHWSDSFSLEGLENAIATVSVYDRDVAHSDHLIGENIFSLSNISFDSKRIEKKIDLRDDEVKVGEILLEFEPISCGFEMEAPGAVKKRSSSLMDKIREEVSSIGEKIGCLGKSIEEKLGFGTKTKLGDYNASAFVGGLKLSKSHSCNEYHDNDNYRLLNLSEEEILLDPSSEDLQGSNSAETSTLFTRSLDLLESFGERFHDILNRETNKNASYTSGVELGFSDKGMHKRHGLDEKFDHVIANIQSNNTMDQRVILENKSEDETLLDKGIEHRSKSENSVYGEKIDQWHIEANKHPDIIHMENNYICPERGFVFGD